MFEMIRPVQRLQAQTNSAANVMSMTNPIYTQQCQLPDYTSYKHCNSNFH